MSIRSRPYVSGHSIILRPNGSGTHPNRCTHEFSKPPPGRWMRRSARKMVTPAKKPQPSCATPMAHREKCDVLEPFAGSPMLKRVPEGPLTHRGTWVSGTIASRRARRHCSRPFSPPGSASGSKLLRRRKSSGSNRFAHRSGTTLMSPDSRGIRPETARGKLPSPVHRNCPRDNPGIWSMPASRLRRQRRQGRHSS